MRADLAVITALRARIAAIGTSSTGIVRGKAAVSLGLDEIDRKLPAGGLPRATLHEIIAADGSAAALGFSAMLLARAAGNEGTVIWCRRHRGLYGLGLIPFGLDPSRLLLVYPRREADVFWTMEEALRSGAVAAVLGEVTTAPPIALRRLQLAAETGGTIAFLTRPPTAATAGFAFSRWRVVSAPNALNMERGSDGRWRRPLRWRLERLPCKAGPAASWLIEWCDATHCLRMAADLRHRPAEPAPSSRRHAV